MNIGWCSVSPWASTGYGRVTREITHRLLDRHEVTALSYESDVIVWGGMKTYDFGDGKTMLNLAMSNPLTNRGGTADMTRAYARRHKMDLLIGHWDAFALQFMADTRVPYLVYIPVDGPMNRKWADYVKDAERVILYSKYGYGECSGFFPKSKLAYIPHGVDVNVFHPLKTKKSVLRKALDCQPEVPEDAFLFVYTGANYGERKCCLPGTKIITLDSVKNIEDIVKGDFVLTHKGRFRKVTEVITSPYKGKVLGITPRCVNRTLWVTPEHPILASKRRTEHERKINGKTTGDSKKNYPTEEPHWVNARELTTDYMCVTPRIVDSPNPPQINTIEYIDTKNIKQYGDSLHSIGRNQFGVEFIHPTAIPIKSVINPSPNMCRLFGYYISEGAATRGILEFYFGKHEREYITDTSQLMLEELSLRNVRVLERSAEKGVFGVRTSATMVYGTSGLHSKLFAGLFGHRAANKHIPPWMLQLPSKNLSEMFKGLWNGDGSLIQRKESPNNPLIEYTTISEELAQEIFLLLVKLGAAPSYRLGHNNSRKLTITDPYLESTGLGLKSVATHLKSSSYISKDYAFFPIREIKEAEYEGPTYNLEVEEDESYVADSIVVHNCIPLLMRTFSKFAAGHQDAHLYLHLNSIANAPQGYDLPMLRHFLGMDGRIHFPAFDPILEQASDADFVRLYNAADVFVSNSEAEGFGLPILESEACGVPVIAPRTTSQTELVEGHGWLVDAVDPESYVRYTLSAPTLQANAVPDQKSLLDMMHVAYDDSKMRRRYGREARKFALDYSWDKLMPKWFSLLEDVGQEIGMFKELSLPRPSA